MIAVLLLLFLFGLLFAWSIGVINRLVGLRNSFKNAFAQVDVHLKKRYALIPEVVETVQGALANEPETLTAIIAARERALLARKPASADPTNTDAIRGVAQTDAEVAVLMERLKKSLSAHPELKTSAAMNRLLEDLTSTEGRVASALRSYNKAVEEYNAARAAFPNVIFGKAFPKAQSLEAPTLPR